MNLEQVTNLSISFLLVFIASWGILQPFFSNKLKKGTIAQSKLEQNKERVLANLEDLEFDFLAKKISEEEYNKSKRELLAEASSILS